MFNIFSFFLLFSFLKIFLKDAANVWIFSFWPLVIQGVVNYLLLVSIPFRGKAILPEAENTIKHWCMFYWAHSMVPSHLMLSNNNWKLLLFWSLKSVSYFPLSVVSLSLQLFCKMVNIKKGSNMLISMIPECVVLLNIASVILLSISVDVIFFHCLSGCSLQKTQEPILSNHTEIFLYGFNITMIEIGIILSFMFFLLKNLFQCFYAADML